MWLLSRGGDTAISQLLAKKNVRLWVISAVGILNSVVYLNDAFIVYSLKVQYENAILFKFVLGKQENAMCDTPVSSNYMHTNQHAETRHNL